MRRFKVATLDERGKMGYTLSREKESEKGKPRAIWGRKIVRPEFPLIGKRKRGIGRLLKEKNNNPGDLPGFFFGKIKSARHFEVKRRNK